MLFKVSSQGDQVRNLFNNCHMTVDPNVCLTCLGYFLFVRSGRSDIKWNARVLKTGSGPANG